MSITKQEATTDGGAGFVSETSSSSVPRRPLGLAFGGKSKASSARRFLCRTVQLS